MEDNNDSNSGGGNTLGEAANRYVTFQIVSAVIGGIIFLIVFFTFFLPMFNHSNQVFVHVNQASPFPTQVTPSSGVGPGTQTLTINGRPATPEAQRSFEQHMNPPQPSASGSQIPAVPPK